MANKEENKRKPLFIRRKMERVKTRLNLEYILDPIEKEFIDENEKQNLIKFTSVLFLPGRENRPGFSIKTDYALFTKVFHSPEI